MIIVKATLYSKKGNETALENFLTDMIDKVKKEPNTLTYTLHRAIENPLKYFFFEEYPTKEAFQEHLNTPHFAKLVENIKDLLDGEPKIETYERLKTL